MERGHKKCPECNGGALGRWLMHNHVLCSKCKLSGKLNARIRIREICKRYHDRKMRNKLDSAIGYLKSYDGQLPGYCKVEEPYDGERLITIKDIFINETDINNPDLARLEDLDLKDL